MLCMALVTSALIALALRAVFAASILFNSKYNLDCGPCESCQEVGYFMLIWYLFVFIPEGFPLLVSLSSTLPLVFSLWLMTTPEDRALLLHPGRFRTEGIALQKNLLQPVQTEREENLYAERLRLGINLQ